MRPLFRSMVILLSVSAFTVSLAAPSAQASCLSKAQELYKKRDGHRVNPIPAAGVSGAGGVYIGFKLLALGTGSAIYGISQMGAPLVAVAIAYELAFGRLDRSIKFFTQVEKGDGPAVRRLYRRLLRDIPKDGKMVEFSEFAAQLQKGNTDETLCIREHGMNSRQKVLKLTEGELGLD